uniref:preprotein translocase subunit SecY n=1 Tax=Rhodella violacea TaxID=2801 RepID=UPI001FCDCDA4|nr:preprotein translocase subunit SecY [Rhodella violacea]UNJ18026.1 preprotein translocase subunit SecY [Rhodella violacea]
MNQKLQEKLLVTLKLLALARLGIFIPIPGIDHNTFYNNVQQNSFVNFLNIFSGGGFSTIGVCALGIVPYINSSIFMQFGVKIFPYLEKLQEEEGESGRQKITQLTRYLTFVWALIQSVAITFWIRPYVFNWNFSFILDTILALTAGSLIILWISDLITKDGIGNGVSLLIFQNIVAGIPKTIEQSIAGQSFVILAVKAVLIIVLFSLIILMAIFIQEGTRRIKIVSIKQLGLSENISESSYLPLKLNNGNVMPIVFASALMAIPPYFLKFINNTGFINLINEIRQPLYIISYGILIVFFSYFYILLNLNPNDISKNLKKMGVSIVGVRPGKITVQYLLNKLTFIGAILLFFLAIIPYITGSVTKINMLKGLGVTSLMILVGVSIDFAKQIQTYLISQKYDEMTK